MQQILVSMHRAAVKAGYFWKIQIRLQRVSAFVDKLIMVDSVTCYARVLLRGSKNDK